MRAVLLYMAYTDAMSSTQQSGRIFMFDGPDGVGKTSVLQQIADNLTTRGYTVHTTRVHGGTSIGEQLRSVSLSKTPRTAITDLYISKAIHAELAHDLQKRRHAGEICLVDRSPAAMWAYQVRAGCLDLDFALPIINDSFLMFKADAVLVYKADLHVLHERLSARGDGKTDYFESQPDSYHERVIVGYAETVELFDTTLIDAHAPMADVAARTMRYIDPLLPTLDT